MTWAEVIENPYLKDLPFKIELNEWGQIVMSPAANNHGSYQFEVGMILNNQKTDGAVSIECSIETSKGTKVPDVVWMSSKFIVDNSYDEELDTPMAHAPELCVEVVSPSNTPDELSARTALFFERGALEVWLCSTKGEIRFFDSNGEIAQSVLFPNFPRRISSPFAPAKRTLSNGNGEHKN